MVFTSRSYSIVFTCCYNAKCKHILENCYYYLLYNILNCTHKTQHYRTIFYFKFIKLLVHCRKVKNNSLCCRNTNAIQHWYTCNNSTWSKYTVMLLEKSDQQKLISENMWAKQRYSAYISCICSEMQSQNWRGIFYCCAIIL